MCFINGVKCWADEARFGGIVIQITDPSLDERKTEAPIFEDGILKAVQLWSDYRRAKDALREAGLVRSFKSAESDFSEWLVKTIFTGELPTSQSQESWDVIAGDKRIQVKSVAKAASNPNGYIVQTKDRQNTAAAGATHYVFVFFNALAPEALYLVPEDFVRNFSKKQIKQSDLSKTTFKVEIDFSAFSVSPVPDGDTDQRPL